VKRARLEALEVLLAVLMKMIASSALQDGPVLPRVLSKQTKNVQLDFIARSVQVVIRQQQVACLTPKMQVARALLTGSLAAFALLAVIAQRVALPQYPAMVDTSVLANKWLRSDRSACKDITAVEVPRTRSQMTKQAVSVQRAATALQVLADRNQSVHWDTTVQILVWSQAISAPFAPKACIAAVKA
jgi:hypothetical protein